MFLIFSASENTLECVIKSIRTDRVEYALRALLLNNNSNEFCIQAEVSSIAAVMADVVTAALVLPSYLLRKGQTTTRYESFQIWPLKQPQKASF